MNNAPLAVLYIDEYLLAVSKPASLPTMGVGNRPSLLAIAKTSVAQENGRPDDEYLHVVNRLDAPVTGVVLLARTPEAARRVTEQLRAGTVIKRYWALLDEPPEPHQAICVDWVRGDNRHRRVHVTQRDQAHAKEARLSYSTVSQLPRATLVEITLLTGRKHQIRVQLAHRGRPIIGDRKYGSRTPFDEGIALHALRLELTHPIRSLPLHLTAPPPACWRKWGDVAPIAGL